MPAERIAYATHLRRNGAGRSRGRAAWSAVALMLAGLACALLPSPVLAQAAGGGLPLLVGQQAGSTSYSVPIQTLLFFTALSFLPAVLLLMTSFTRIVIVLSLVRQALGTQAAPPNQVVIGLSLFLTFFVMGPTIDKVYADAYQPYADNKIAFDEAIKRGESPVRGFMMKQTRQSDVMLFAKLAKIDPSVKTADVPFKVLLPAFVTSELKSAFQIGFLVLPAVSHHRHDRGQRADVARHGDALARAHRPAVQADAVRARRWLEPSSRLARRELRDLEPNPPWIHSKSSPSASRASTCC